MPDPPPEPPSAPALQASAGPGGCPAPPPPVEVIVEKIESFNCDKTLLEVKQELLKRLYKPIYIPIIGMLTCFLIITSSNKINYNAVGASGAVMGIVYSSILLYPKMTLYFIIIPMPAYIFGLLYLWYSIYSMKNIKDNIGHEAHLGGAIAGFFITIFLKPEIVSNSFSTVLILLIPIIYFYLKNR